MNLLKKIRKAYSKICFILNDYENLHKRSEDFINFSELQFEARKLHEETFSEYRNCFAGKDVAVIGGGPTLESWVAPKDCIQIGVNGTIVSDACDLDFLFWQDYSENFANVLYSQKKEKCTYFYGFHYMIPNVDVIPLYEAEKVNAKRYFFYDCPKNFFPFDFTLDISQKPFITYGSTIFCALQFALYTHPARIYIVGCDCSKGHMANYPPFKLNEPVRDVEGLDTILEGWKKFAVFARQLYPDIEIISVNPVGLKGIFKDFYTLKNTRGGVQQYSVTASAVGSSAQVCGEAA